MDQNGIVVVGARYVPRTMSADKTTVFLATTTPVPSPTYQFLVIHILGATYAQADLGGNWWYHRLNTGGWNRGKFSVDPVTGAVNRQYDYVQSSWTR